jgi:AcrR family transcriptional regulator
VPRRRQVPPESEPDEPLWLLAAPAIAAPARTTARSLGRTPGLTRDRIVSTAIAIADREGPESVTMRRVARDLSVSPMALYWHVASKEDLQALMVDKVEGEIEIPTPSGDWRADLTKTARRYRETLLRHGWMTTFIGLRRSLGPNELPHIEHSLAALDHLGLTIRQAFNILMAVETYYLGFALREQQELAAQHTREPMGPAQARRGLFQEARRLRATGLYPHLAALFEEGKFLTRDERFDFGLARLLDGIEGNLPAKSTGVSGD